MKKQSREVTVGIGLVVVSLSAGVLFATNVYHTKTFKTINNVEQKEISYNIKTTAKQYSPTTIAYVNVKPEENNKEMVDTNIEIPTPIEVPEVKTEVIEPKEEIDKPIEEEIIEESIVYDGLTMNELIEKLNRNMSSNISGMGNVYASYALEIGIDPYLALAITLHETGCNGTSGCSRLVRECNNVGGQKGSPSCDGGSYKKYDTLEAGIKGYMDNIKKNYYDYGLTTPETMNKKYAADPNWATKINKYIDKIKAN